MQFFKKKSIKMVDQIQHCPLMATIINYTKYQYFCNIQCSKNIIRHGKPNSEITHIQ